MSQLARDHIRNNILDQIDELYRYLDESKRIPYTKKSAVPASATASGFTGDISWDDSYIYICTATNTWKRVAVATW